MFFCLGAPHTLHPVSILTKFILSFKIELEGSYFILT